MNPQQPNGQAPQPISPTPLPVAPVTVLPVASPTTEMQMPVAQAQQIIAGPVAPQSAVPSTPMSPVKVSRFRPKRLLKIFIPVVVVIIIAVIGVVVLARIGEKSYLKSQVNESVTLDGSTLQFSRPENMPFFKDAKSTVNDTKVSAKIYLAKNKSARIFATHTGLGLDAYREIVGKEPKVADEIAILQKDLNEGNKESSIKDYYDDIKESGLEQSTIRRVSAYTNASTQDGLMFEFDGKSKIEGSNEEITIKGIYVIALNRKDAFKFIFTARDDAFLNNKEAIDKVINSLVL